MSTQRKPIRIEKRIINGQEVNVKIYPVSTRNKRTFVDVVKTSKPIRVNRSASGVRK